MGNPLDLFTNDPVALSISIGIMLFAGLMLFVRWRSNKKPQQNIKVLEEEQRILQEVKIRYGNEDREQQLLREYREKHGEEKAKIVEAMLIEQRRNGESQQSVEAEPVQTKVTIGVGAFKAMVFSPGSIMKWTTIPVPIGELYQADTSCPLSGGIYIVKELENGEVVDFDPREVPIKTEETPEYAWFATHWNVVRRVFALPLAWFRNPANWYAAGVLALLFITILVAVGD